MQVLHLEHKHCWQQLLVKGALCQAQARVNTGDNEPRNHKL
jgi:hypothetical protein